MPVVGLAWLVLFGRVMTVRGKCGVERGSREGERGEEQTLRSRSQVSCRVFLKSLRMLCGVALDYFNLSDVGDKGCVEGGDIPLRFYQPCLGRCWPCSLAVR